jgi:hypothetical protein
MKHLDKYPNHYSQYLPRAGYIRTYPHIRITYLHKDKKHVEPTPTILHTSNLNEIPLKMQFSLLTLLTICAHVTALPGLLDNNGRWTSTLVFTHLFIYPRFAFAKDPQLLVYINRYG